MPSARRWRDLVTIILKSNTMKNNIRPLTGYLFLRGLFQDVISLILAKFLHQRRQSVPFAESAQDSVVHIVEPQLGFPVPFQCEFPACHGRYQVLTDFTGGCSRHIAEHDADAFVVIPNLHRGFLFGKFPVSVTFVFDNHR